MKKGERMSSEIIDVNGAESQYEAEKECLNIVTNKRNQTPAVKSVLAKITNNGNYKIIPTASNQPLDFTIIEPKTGLFKGGIEHFSIGFEYTRNQGIRIFSKLQTEKGKETYNNYHNNLDGNEITALHDLTQIAKNELLTVNAFDYYQFIKEFNRIMSKHLKKIGSYCDRIGCSHKDICFLIDLCIPCAAKWQVNYGNGYKKQNHDQFPISKDFIDVLKTASPYGIENIILVIHDTWGRDYERVLYFNTNNMEKSCKRQNLAICNDFKPFSFPNITDIEVVYRNGQFDIYYSFGS